MLPRRSTTSWKLRIEVAIDSLLRHPRVLPSTGGPGTARSWSFKGPFGNSKRVDLLEMTSRNSPQKVHPKMTFSPSLPFKPSQLLAFLSLSPRTTHFPAEGTRHAKGSSGKDKASKSTSRPTARGPGPHGPTTPSVETGSEDDRCGPGGVVRGRGCRW